MKKIVIIPCFAESHFVEFQIDNIVNTLSPDIIIYNEGLFPAGPEGKGGIDDTFKRDFCFKDTNLAWDTLELQTKISNAQQKYPDIRIIWNHMSYENMHDPNECYVKAVSNFETFNINVEPGDLIFPLEGDVFFHHDDVQLLNEYIHELNNDSGLQAPYLDFIENQYYVEGDSLNADKIHKRRIVIKFGTWEYYKNIVGNFTSQKYPQLHMFPRYVFHYAWWRPGKYKELRFRQLIRPKYYSDAVRQALLQAQENKLERIILRPDRSEDDLSRYIVCIDIDHPKEIINHPNYIKSMIAEKNYLRCCKRVSDINEHLPTLHQYSLQCKHITEMGVREVVSTWAFLNAKPDTLISYDIYTSSNIKEVYVAAAEVNTKFTFKQADVLKIDIEETDLLFIDTLHQYEQLKQELNKHAPKVRKYIIMHDTTKFAFIDERTGQPGGLWPAVEDFLTHNSEWQLIERYTNNNGLTIIGRI